MSDGSRLQIPVGERRRTELEANDSHENSENKEPDRGEQLTVGMYFRKAGTRDAGGVVMYVQELLDAVADRNPAYLYTESGELTPKMRETEAEVVQLGDETKAAGRLRESLPTANSALFSVLGNHLVPALGMVRDGTIRHMNENLDVLVTHDFLDDLVLSNLLDVPVIRVFHGFERAGIGMQVRELLSSGYSVANTEQTKREFIDHLDYEPDGVVYPGVDVQRFHPDVTPAFGRGDEWEILFVGRFVEAKGIFDLVDAVAELPDDVHLRLVGRGDTAALKRRIESRELDSKITIEGAIPHDELPGYYAAADVFCLPSRYESFGMVNVEAMACGTPVVTTNLEGITEYATDRETALLVPPESPAEIAGAISALRSSPGLRTRLEANGRETATRYSWEMAAKNLVDICSEIVTES
ncbi:Glycosyltransferase involved in cell wall bisynthesis [Haladaptatus litoreus]|uniref:Glycosyltransferase involved in cell wall bisynthesis n=1 Tax=Haladaptatus litoreus TaxID=553468 RepID=A0A1N6WAU6_9EURY|nr:glycosyltransferase family 4 protein [Haladaptatus litoreus]SIQ87142.1 Glycosyltransferase involved in cell wall bisynthesis [Haladaptatus litoreus]